MPHKCQCPVLFVAFVISKKNMVLLISLCKSLCRMKFADQSGLLLKERICSKRSKFFPLRVDPRIENGRVASLETVPIHWKRDLVMCIQLLISQTLIPQTTSFITEYSLDIFPIMYRKSYCTNPGIGRGNVGDGSVQNVKVNFEVFFM